MFISYNKTGIIYSVGGGGWGPNYKKKQASMEDDLKIPPDSNKTSAQT